MSSNVENYRCCYNIFELSHYQKSNARITRKHFLDWILLYQTIILTQTFLDQMKIVVTVRH